MSVNNDHNHFCIYCGAKLEPNQKFCIRCGERVFHEEKVVEPVPSKYGKIIDDLEDEYDLKQKRAMELLNKLFDSNHLAYDKFASSINRSNQLFNNQLQVTKKIIEVDDDSNELVEKEIESKIKTLETFIDKMDDLINELVIQLSSNEKDNDDINNFFDEMDDLINSVKDY